LNKYLKGDLVYIPQAVNLFSYNADSRHAGTTMRLKVPRNCLVVKVDEESSYVCVLYNGEFWHVKVEDIYPTQKEVGNV
tara:strand:+ start:1841 stop:2077 length:237 start_codon:yes stop_codon:yes gene_type:complete